MKGFAGRIIHSADFGDAKNYAGKKVLVVGAGNSGFDALNHLAAANTAAIWLSARNGPALLPKRIGQIAVHRFSPILARLPLRVADAVMAATQRLVFGDLTTFGLPPTPSGGASRLASDYTAIATDDGAVDAIKYGRIIVRADDTGIHPRRRHLGQWQPIHPDIVIAATGYRTGLEPMVGKLGVLDDKGVPLFNGGASRPETARPVVHRHAAEHSRLLRQCPHPGQGDRPGNHAAIRLPPLGRSNSSRPWPNQPS